MTTQRDADRILRAWLELMPDEAPDRTVAAVLQAVEATPQTRRPVLRGPRRPSRMNRFVILGTAAVLGAAILGGALLLGGGRGVNTPTQVAVATAQPTASPLRSAAGEDLPTSLHYRWIGEERVVPTLGTSTRTGLDFTATSFRVTGTKYSLGGVMASSASTDGSRLRLVAESTTGGCAIGDVGTYGWTLSPGGTTLVVDTGQDTCAARAAAVPGTWHRVACRNMTDGCWGVLEAGTYPSQYVDPRLDIGEVWAPRLGALEFTVPDGWANSSDWPNTFSLTPAANYALESPNGPAAGELHEILLFTQPFQVVQEATCAGKPDSGADRSVQGLLAYLRSLEGLTVSPETPVTIDGHSGIAVDLALAADANGRCPDQVGPALPLFAQAGDRENAYGVGIVGNERIRLTLLDLGGGDIVGIIIDSSDPATFDELATSAQPIIDSFRFR
ncbi:MAG TPA: hypothetical protein VFQ75_06295 [Candidatus Limnocylindrales bacterium]|nr:hypothetical protein [Candidatus Limnocylindrales bacterium]